MVITRAPFRVSFVGGGSDINSFYEHQMGAVLSTSINKYMYISSHRFFNDHEICIKYSKTETVNSFHDIEHPLFREVLKQFNVSGVEINSNADIPSGTGLGSSSSFTVALLLNFFSRHSKLVDKHFLANEACDIEINRLKDPIGKQDQFAASFGGLNIFSFHPNGSVSVDPIFLNPETYYKLENNLLMFYTGSQRKASDILADQKKSMTDSKKRNILSKMVDLVWEIKSVLHQGKIDHFGQLLHQNWLYKRELSNGITNDFIDTIYNTGLKNGALGGKLLGAGGSGFMLFYCPQDKHAQLRDSFSHLKEIPFKFEQDGAKLIYVGDEYEHLSK